ncbi:hypothetical protein LCGC14_1081560 [marine sediment metagenome]|uniref:Uncharacterized protein n=1 Tax=marine sediment metagenome TaxID=412755 RepID=A0A0F9MF58_9ZZZZ
MRGILIDINDKKEPLETFDDIILNMYNVGEKIVFGGIQYKVTEVLHHLDEDDVIVNVVKEGRYRG